MKKNSEKTRIASEYSKIRKRGRDELHLANDLTEVDRIYAHTLEKIYFKEKKKDEKDDLFDSIF